MQSSMNIKDFVYTPAFKDSKIPVFYLEKKENKYYLKCFFKLFLSDEFKEFMEENKLVKPQQIETDQFSVDEIVKMGMTVALKNNCHVIVEAWDSEKGIDMGPMVLYDSKALLN